MAQNLILRARSLYPFLLTNRFLCTINSFALGRYAAQMISGQLQPLTPHTFHESVYLELVTALCSGAKHHSNRFALSMSVILASGTYLYARVLSCICV